jgi:uncharacterized membrane protein YciS (DUF1049 family)
MDLCGKGGSKAGQRLRGAPINNPPPGALLLESARSRRIEMAEQSFQSHAKWLPPFHFFVLPVLLINIGFQIYWCVKTWFSVSGVLAVVVAVALFVGIGIARGMALKVQDRVIRLEERLRFERVLPADLHPRIGEFTIDQLVALRFASNAELPELVRKVLEEKLNDRKAIKQMIKTWRPDFARA